MNRILLSAATCAAALLSTGAMAAPPEPKPLSAQTRANLEAAMHGEAYANLKYLRCVRGSAGWCARRTPWRGAAIVS